MALAADGSMFTWGSGQHGQLGLEDVANYVEQVIASILAIFSHNGAPGTCKSTPQPFHCLTCEEESASHVGTKGSASIAEPMRGEMQLQLKYA